MKKVALLFICTCMLWACGESSESDPPGGGTAGGTGGSSTATTGSSATGGGSSCTDKDGDGYGDGSSCRGSDCDDNNAKINPGMTEVCQNKVDDDCNKGTTDDCQGGQTGCTDLDGDGYGNGASCLGGGNEPDCNDNDNTVNPAATEQCGNSKDDDCNPQTSDVCPVCKDADGDGFGEGGACKGPDCNDANKNTYPGAIEICKNGLDDNCNGTVDTDCLTCKFDGDKDGSCGTLPNGDPGPDCDDNNAFINPKTPEKCDGIDNNCNKQVDECGKPNYSCQANPSNSSQKICIGSVGADCSAKGSICEKGLICSKGFCKKPKGTKCQNDNECASGYRCYSTNNNPKICDAYLCSKHGCPNTNDKCDKVNNRCVQCLKVADCSSFSKDHRCTPGGRCLGPRISFRNVDNGTEKEALNVFLLKTILNCFKKNPKNSTAFCNTIYTDPKMTNPYNSARPDYITGTDIRAFAKKVYDENKQNSSKWTKEFGSGKTNFTEIEDLFGFTFFN